MIGLGGFSRVFLARHNENLKFYALKIIEKKFLIQNNKEDIILNERLIMI
jgi:serum/glucocorticoid-regulated kinase 2